MMKHLLLLLVVILASCVTININEQPSQDDAWFEDHPDYTDPVYGGAQDDVWDTEWEDTDPTYDPFTLPPLEADYDTGVEWEDDSFHAFDCTPRTFTEELAVSDDAGLDSGEGIGLTVEIEIFGVEEGKCTFIETVIEDDNTLGFDDKSMTCLFPDEELTGEITDYCSGSLVDAYFNFIEGDHHD
ncbi:MAG: hypothetical protein ABIH34_02395 [Nanoarchaeota archaeon]